MVVAGGDQIGGFQGGPKEGEAARFAEAHAEGGTLAASGHFRSGSTSDDLETRSSSWKQGSEQGELWGGVVGEGARGRGSEILVVER